MSRDNTYRQEEPLFPLPLLKRMFNQKLTLKKASFTKGDIRLGASYPTFQEYPIDGQIQPITYDAMTITLAGEVDLAVAVGFVRDYYWINGERVEVVTRDLLVTENGDQWRVLSAIRQFDGKKSGYRILSLQKVD